jgi:hypothetical protein
MSVLIVSAAQWRSHSMFSDARQAHSILPYTEIRFHFDDTGLCDTKTAFKVPKVTLPPTI